VTWSHLRSQAGNEFPVPKNDMHNIQEARIHSRPYAAKVSQILGTGMNSRFQSDMQQFRKREFILAFLAAKPGVGQ